MLSKTPLADWVLFGIALLVASIALMQFAELWERHQALAKLQEFREKATAERIEAQKAFKDALDTTVKPKMDEAAARLRKAQ